MRTSCLYLSLLLFVLSISAPALAQSIGAPPAASQSDSAGKADSLSNGHLVLVLPFENHSSQANVDWIGESVPEVMNRRLASAGFLPIGRDDRLYALDHLGLPPNFRPSRASTIRLAQNLDADSVIAGSYSSDGKRLTITARILDVNSLRLSAPIESQVDLPRLLDGINSEAWKLVRQIDPAYPVAETTFIAADAKLPLGVFENYIRGLVETAPAERVKHLKLAVQMDPAYFPAWLALGKVYFHEQQYEQAAAALGKVPRTDPQALGAAFDRGLASFYTGNYVQAEESFAVVAAQLPLSEVINNQAVAASRRNRDAAALFQQAISVDPNDADYHFNLALALRRRGDGSGAMREVNECVKLKPQDAEAQALLASIQAQSSNSAVKVNTSTAPASATEGAGPTGPLERIKRTYNETAFRQAAYEIDQMQALKLEALPPAARSSALTTTGVRSLNQGLLLEAERQFQEAIQAEAGNSAAHAGLAQVRERSGDPGDARVEAQQSLQLKPNADAHLVLARLDLEANQLPSAAGEVTQALQLEPKNPAALGLRQAIQAKGQQVP